MLFRYMKIIVILFTILNSSITIQAQEECSAASGAENSSCISIGNCPPILKLLRESKTDADRETLKKLQCGFEGNVPKICCPENAQETAPTNVTSMSRLDPSGRNNPPDVSKHPNLKLINDPTCGVFTEVKIFGGDSTQVLEFPWMALIAYKIDGQGSNQFGCGASLITKRYVLTAAHCVTSIHPRFELIGVRIGEHDISKERDCDISRGVEVVCADKYQDFAIEKLHVHSEYVKATHKNDVALIRLNGELDFSRYNNVKPICLPVGDVTDLQSKKVIVTGWGMTELGVRSRTLLKVKLEVAPNDECEKLYREKNGIEVWYKQLCAGGKSHKDSCMGDSGGPLQYPAIINGQPKYVQHGIVAFGPDGCGVIGYPGVYTRVAYYMDWILDTITE